MPSHKPDISVHSVTKIFKTGIFTKKTAVSDISFSIPRGEVVGLLGPNGSGKSTTLKMILGFLHPTKGEIQVCGKDSKSREARFQIGYLPENPRFPKFLKAKQALHYYGALYRLSHLTLEKKADELLELVGLKDVAEERIKGFSKGMVQRLAIAQSLINKPRILIFDEPMSGLDPLGRMEIRNLIKKVHLELKDSTIFFSSHVLEDVEQLCSYVALLGEGLLKTFSTTEALLSSEGQKYDITLEEEMIRTVSGVENLVKDLSQLIKEKRKIVGVHPHRKNLEEALFRENETVQTNRKEVAR